MHKALKQTCLYLLVAMVFTLIASFQALAADQVQQMQGKQGVALDKEWTIVFNSAVDNNTIIEENIYVNDYSGKRINTTVKPGSNDKTAAIKPTNAYAAVEDYTLYLLSTIKATSGLSLRPVAMNFITGAFDVPMKSGDYSIICDQLEFTGETKSLKSTAPSNFRHVYYYLLDVYGNEYPIAVSKNFSAEWEVAFESAKYPNGSYKLAVAGRNTDDELLTGKQLDIVINNPTSLINKIVFENDKLNCADFEYGMDSYSRQLDYSLAYWLAQVCEDSYRDDASCKTSLMELGFAEEKINLEQYQGSLEPVYEQVLSENYTKGELPPSCPASQASLQAVLANKDIITRDGTKTLVLIAFRGSDEAADWYQDFSYTPIRYDKRNDDCNVHIGFYLSERCFEANLEPKISLKIGSRTINLNEIKNDSEKLKTINDNCIFIITGHSYGGALASLYSARLLDLGISSNHLICYTFGAPPVGNYTGFCQYYESSNPMYLHRIVNSFDPVPAIDIVQATALAHIDQNRNMAKYFPLGFHLLTWYISNLEPLCPSWVKR